MADDDWTPYPQELASVTVMQRLTVLRGEIERRNGLYDRWIARGDMTAAEATSDSLTWRALEADYARIVGICGELGLDPAKPMGATA